MEDGLSSCYFSSTDSPSDLSSNIIFSGKPKNLQKKGSFVDTTDPNAPILAPCPAESYCPGGTTLTPISCPSGTGTLGSPGAGSSDQCVPQDPCVPDPNTCCSGPITQPGWPFYGPYLCSGVGGLCTNTAVDKNVSQRRGGRVEDGLSSCYFGPTSTPKKTTHPFFRPSFPLSFSLEFIPSIQNCGSCGAACSADVAVSCCSGACTNLATSGANCGACGAACLGGSTCQGGTCLCPRGTTFSADGRSCLVPPGKTVSPDGSVVTCPSDAW